MAFESLVPINSFDRMTTPMETIEDAASSPAASSAHEPVFPSVRRDAPLVSSYTYHSTEAGCDEVEGEWMIGIDEAGRGPVLGQLRHGLEQVTSRRRLIPVILQVLKYTASRFASLDTVMCSRRTGLQVSHTPYAQDVSALIDESCQQTPRRSRIQNARLCSRPLSSKASMSNMPRP